MIGLLENVDAQCYYGLSSEQREAWFEEAITSHESWPLPLNFLSVFEICLAHSLLLRSGDLVTASPFIECWDEFADFQYRYSYGGDHLTLLEFFDEEVEFYKALEEIQLPHGVDDGALYDHYSMTMRLRAICKKILQDFHPYSDSCWILFDKYRFQFPTKLPTRDQPRGDGSAVIDCNSLLDLLEQLDPRGIGPVDLRSRNNLDVTARSFCQSLLDDHGRARKIIIPITVLEECHRVATRQENKHVLRVLEGILESDMPLWASFEFEPFSLSVLKSYLHVRESCVPLKLADAIVVAHAVKDRLPVISGDGEIKAASSQFPFLALS